MKNSVPTKDERDIFSSYKPDIPSPGGIATTAMQNFGSNPSFHNVNIFQILVYLKIKFSLLEQG
jgi:hypothetical protein